MKGRTDTHTDPNPANWLRSEYYLILPSINHSWVFTFSSKRLRNFFYNHHISWKFVLGEIHQRFSWKIVDKAQILNNLCFIQIFLIGLLFYQLSCPFCKNIFGLWVTFAAKQQQKQQQRNTWIEGNILKHYLCAALYSHTCSKLTYIWYTWDIWENYSIIPAKFYLFNDLV